MVPEAHQCRVGDPAEQRRGKVKIRFHMQGLFRCHGQRPTGVQGLEQSELARRKRFYFNDMPARYQ